MSTFKDLRKQANISPTEAYKKLDVARSTIYAIEDMETFPSARVLNNMVKVYRPSAFQLGEAVLNQLDGIKAGTRKAKKMTKHIKN